MNETQKLLDAWLPPEGAGAAVGCLATSFTFEPEFFENECLARFLSLDTARNEESELSFLIEQEERLAETRAAVVVDRSYQAEGWSLRWDILAVGLRGGVQHAKVCLLLWEDALRLILGSANLVASAYRRNVETGVVLDALRNTTTPKEPFVALIDALRAIVNAAEGRPDEAGPKQRALQTLDRAFRHLGDVNPRSRRGRTARVAVAWVRPGVAALPQLKDVWSGSLPERAAVMSPFFDVDEATNVATAALIDKLRRRGHIDVTFVVPVDYVEGRSVVRAPRSILAHQNYRVGIDFRSFKLAEGSEPRRLHAKVVLFESRDWIAALVGSSNFTAAGLGLRPAAGNIEVNLFIGAPSGSAEGGQLRQLIQAGDVLDPDDGDWDPERDEDEQIRPALPFGFSESLFDPPPSPEIILRFRPNELPARWSVSLHEPVRRILVESRSWVKAGRPSEMRIGLLPSEHPFLLRVDWNGGSADWPLNVTDPARLPPPERLRELPADALIRALASIRPLHEALAAVLEKSNGREQSASELDALKRYSSTGHLFQRTRRLSEALDGLQRRLERPVVSLDVLVWRLRGPFGPRALADGFSRADRQDETIVGEPAFFIAELALVLGRVDWSKTAEFLALEDVVKVVRSELRYLRKLARAAPVSDDRLRRYVERALREARV